MRKKRQLVLVMILSSVVLATLASCSIKSQRMAKLLQIDSLIEKHPQQAYDSLKSFEKQTETPDPESVTMKYRVLMAEVQNKLYKQMPSDSVFQEVVDYYDNKGTANEKMQAHYLLGCIYRDQKEAPMAIKCYNEAVECADTLSKDCDYITLFSIYGQMADVFADQYLPEEAIKASKMSSSFALKAGDKYNYILGLELCIPYYYMLGDTAKVYSQTKKCAELYYRNRMKQMAVQTYPTLIKVLMDNRHFKQAADYMKMFEKQSGLFDKKNNIQKGREYYYELKARYFYEMNKIDSAEIYYRKLLGAGWNYEATKGLLDVARYHANLDSILKYSALCGKSMDGVLEQAKSDAVLRCVALYNYNRLVKIAEVEKYKKNRLVYIGIIIFISLLLLVICILWRYKWFKKNKEKELMQLCSDYMDSITEMERAKSALHTLRLNQYDVVGQLEQKIINLEAKNQEYYMRFAALKATEKQTIISNNQIVVAFKKMASPKKNTPVPTNNEWKELVDFICHCFPIFASQISEKKLAQQELKVCVLTRLEFTNSEMQILLNTSSQSITNMKAKVNRKLFNKNGASSLYKNLITIAED